MAQRTLSTGTKFIITLALLAVLAVLFFFFININQRSEKKAITSIEQERQQWQEKVAVLEKKGTVHPSEEKASLKSDIQPPSFEAIEPATQIQKITDSEEICHNTTQSLDRIFSYLDNQEYIQQFGFKNGSKAYLSSIAERLYVNKPKIVRETDSLLSIMQNTTHIYRVLGKHDIVILKTILANEKETLEPMLATFFKAADENEQCLVGKYPLTLPLKELYAYSTFFINTMGGQAYLFRRDPTTRILIKYYAILILHKANEQGINTSGVDIRQGLKNLIDELLVFQVLQKRDEYLNTMLVLQAKYDQQYGLGNSPID